jgi:carbamoyltransferase
MTNNKFGKLFDGPRREPESDITQREMNIAASIQKVTEEIVLRLATAVHRDTGARNLCMAGGVALNCVSNGRILREGPYENLWIQPAAGDAGGALGAAQIAWHEYSGQPRKPVQPDQMRGAFLGPKFSSSDIRAALDAMNANYLERSDDELMPEVADHLANEKVVGWFQGRMELGPRALGGRSILGDPRSKKMQSTMNLKIKYRESFRPFAPSVLGDRVSDYFIQDSASPYMLIVAPVQDDIRVKTTPEQDGLFGIDKLNVARSLLPAITHVDYSARVQTVHSETNPRYYRLIKEFESRTGCAVLINTSFNVRGEPIVCTPQDAYQCFMRTEMDFLVIENFVLDKKNQPEIIKDDSWMTEFDLD